MRKSRPAASAPITSAAVRRWFVGARVPGAKPSARRRVERRGLFAGAALGDPLLAAAETFAALVEAQRKRTSAEIQAGVDALDRWAAASHDLLRVLRSLPPFLARLPEAAAQMAALAPVARFSGRRRGRPRDGAGPAAARFDEALAGLLPPGTTKQARLEIVEAALRACGFPPTKTAANVARALRRQRSSGRT